MNEKIRLKIIPIEGCSFLSLENDVGLRLLLSPYGASIYEITYLEKKMNVTDVHPEEWKVDTTYFGKTVGRIAGRIKDSTLIYRGERYSLIPNEGKNSLHGGKEAISDRDFTYDYEKIEGAQKLSFHLYSKDGDNGYPGNLHLVVTYLLLDDKPEFSIHFHSEIDKDCPLNYTNHVYWCLGMKNIEEATLKIKHDKVMTYAEDLIPLELVEPLPILDFRKGKKIKEGVFDPSLTSTKLGGYDHFFHFVDNDKENPVVTLLGDEFSLDIITSLHGVQCYSCNFQKKVEWNTTDDSLHAGVALEPAYTPDDFEAMSPVNHQKDDFITYRFKKI
ncbi:MAG: hypothetical protein K5694_02190 [Bacilli bacterium]|nr:hypothetical protein [Bacilli bacterium]